MLEDDGILSITNILSPGNIKSWTSGFHIIDNVWIGICKITRYWLSFYLNKYSIWLFYIMTKDYIVGIFSEWFYIKIDQIQSLALPVIHLKYLNGAWCKKFCRIIWKIKTNLPGFLSSPWPWTNLVLDLVIPYFQSLTLKQLQNVWHKKQNLKKMFLKFWCTSVCDILTTFVWISCRFLFYNSVIFPLISKSHWTVWNSIMLVIFINQIWATILSSQFAS